MLHEEKVQRLIEAFQKVILKMQEVDNTCLTLTQDISKQDLALISFIGRKGEVIMRDIADYLEVPLSTGTGIVDKLVDKGYLKRHHSDEDRRIVKVGCSQYGTETCELVHQMVFKMGNTILNDMSDQDQEDLIILLEKVTTNLKKHVTAG